LIGFQGKNIDNCSNMVYGMGMQTTMIKIKILNYKSALDAVTREGRGFIVDLASSSALLLFKRAKNEMV